VGLQQLYLHGVQLIRYSDAHAYSQSNADSNPDTYADSNTDPNTNTNTDADADTNSNSKTDSYTNANTKPDAHAHTQWGCGNVEPDTGIDLWFLQRDFHVERG
jgi:hypothetical protein